MKKICSVVLVCALLLSFVSCSREPTVEINDDGYVVVDGVVTDILARTEDRIDVDDDGYLIVNGVKTEHKVHTEDEITVNSRGYVVVNGVKTKYKIHTTDEISINDGGYVVVNGAVTDIIANKEDEIMVGLDGYLIVNDVKTKYKVHKDLPSVDYRDSVGDYLIEKPGGLKTMDYWFFEEMGVYHAYFLEIMPSTPERANDFRIGHAVSEDFLNWKYEGTVLDGYTDGWDDRHLATGSVAKLGDTYYMMYTGHSSHDAGMGLAKSKDLYTWERVGEGPVISSRTYYTAEYKGKEYRVRILADPYIYPEKIDGYFYVLINSWAVDMPYNNRGCQLMFRSKNMLDWEPYKIAIVTDDLDRLETAQMWEHNGKWYMSFGGCYVDPEKGGFNNLWHDNFVYMADRFDGPYEKQEWSRLVYEGAATSPYTQKQIKDPYGDDVMLASAPYNGVLWPYKIVYGEDGSVALVPMAK